MLDALQAKINDFLILELKRRQLDLVALEVQKRSGYLHILVLADRPFGGIALGECTAVNKVLSRWLEEQALTDGEYQVEVSSPGLDWPLATAADFRHALGRDVLIELLQPLADKKEISGVIDAVEQDRVGIKLPDGTTVDLNLADVKLAVQII